MQENKKVKIIIDTNFWISLLIGKELAGLKNLLLENKLQLLMSEEIIE